MIKYILVLFLSALNFSFAQNTLPRWLTDAEKEALKTYDFPVFNQKYTFPPPYPVRAMAEWEELQGIMITWTSFKPILRQIVDHAQEEGNVYIICSDSNSVKTELTNYGIPHKNTIYFQFPYNSIWIRDYGPWSAYTNTVDSLNIIDWIYNRPRPNDDLIPGQFANLMHIPFYETTVTPNDLIHTGGNFMVDGHGTAFSSKLILQENPGKSESEIDSILWKYLNIHRFIKMDVLPYDGIHHIDMHMKLLNEETLLVGEYPIGVADGPYIEANLQYIKNNFLTCFNRPYKIIRIPMPPDQYGRYPDQNGYYRTYTNSIIINKTVLVPTYEQKYDTTALRIYREAMPGYNIIGINCNDIIPLSGALHCITKEVGVANPIRITHVPLSNDTTAQQHYSIGALLEYYAGISNAYLFWKTAADTDFDSLEMTLTRSMMHNADIPRQLPGTKIQYYIKARAADGKTRTKPITAPEGFYQFEIRMPTYISENNPESVLILRNYPNPFNTKTKIEFKLTHKSNISLTIYNSLGQKLTTLVNNQLNAGKYNYTWDASAFASGVYYYRLEAGTECIQIRKLVLLK